MVQMLWSRDSERGLFVPLDMAKRSRLERSIRAALAESRRPKLHHIPNLPRGSLYSMRGMVDGLRTELNTI